MLAARGGSTRFEQVCFLPSSADVYVSGLHRWVHEHGGVPFPGEPLPPRLPLVPLLDRFEAHTRHCRSCRTAHRRLRLWRPRVLAAAVVVPLLALLASTQLAAGLLPAAALLGGLLALVARQMGLWQRGLEQGSGEPPRNASRS